MKKPHLLHTLLLSVCLLSASYSAHAWDGVVAGKIAQLQTVSMGAANYDLRILIAGTTQHCTGDVGNFAYLNATDYNYKAVLAGLLTAFTMGKPVTLHTTLVGGYCKIAYVVMSN